MNSDRTKSVDCIKVHELTVKVYPASTGTVTTKDTVREDFSCTATCSEDVESGKKVSLSVAAKDGYRCGPASVSVLMSSDKEVTVNCNLLLKADAGGSGGHYLAVRSLRRLRGGGSIVTFRARVSASATGGVPPYSFKWLGARLNWGSGQATYIFPASEVFPVSRTVTVRDSASPPNTDTATAMIDTIEQLNSEASASGGDDGGSAFEVPLGGELVLIWGGGGTVAARSEDAGVASISVSSPALLISGLALSETRVIVEVGDGALVLPVVVR